MTHKLQLLMQGILALLRKISAQTPINPKACATELAALEGATRHGGDLSVSDGQNMLSEVSFCLILLDTGQKADERLPRTTIACLLARPKRRDPCREASSAASLCKRK